MKFVIENNKPIPGFDNRPPFGEFSNTLRKLQVGQSFYVAPEEKSNSSTRSAVHYTQKTTGLKYTVRQDGSGVRIWRTA